MGRKKSRQQKLERKKRKSAKAELRHQQRAREHHQPGGLLTGIAEAAALIGEGADEEALEVLEELGRRFPRSTDVFGMLLEVYLEQDDMWSYQATARKLLEVTPDAVDGWFAYAGAALGNGQIVTAYEAFGRALELAPNDKDAAAAKKLRIQLKQTWTEEAAARGIADEDALGTLRMHDEINLNLQLHDYEQVIAVAGALLEDYPKFAPALNNRSQAEYQRGRLDLAIADARRVLEFDPDNVHALSNLSRYLFLFGEREEAQAVAQRLRQIKTEFPDFLAKQAEALAVLGDWRGVLDVLQAVKELGKSDLVGELGLVYHLAGTAAAELGELADARKYWKQSIKVGGAADWSQRNLDDAKLPVGEQNGPWAFPIDHYLPRALFKPLIENLGSPDGEISHSVFRRHVQKFLEQHPYVEALAPVLLERGDLSTKEIVLRVLASAKTPATLAAIKEFAAGQRGSDSLRYSAAMRLVDAGVIKPGPFKMWVKGELRDLHLMSVEISSEHIDPLPSKVQPLAVKAWEAIHAEDGEQAEILLQKALQQCPGNPSLEYNRAVAILIQGRESEAMDVVRRIHARHPDYSFARIRLAEEAIGRRDYDAASELLTPLMSRPRVHLSEYTALCHAQISLHFAQSNLDAARDWLRMWEDVAPDDKRTTYWHSRVKKDGLLGRLFTQR